MWSYAVTAALLGLGSTAYAQVASACQGDVCFGLNIPEDTASSGDGDIYFQLSAPTSYSWVALGQGSSMSGSNIFVIYTSADGNNVTLSPRLGKGETMPEYDDATQVTLLDGTGVSDGNMIANVRCSNCQSWSGGSMDFTGSSAKWIYATKSGSALNSDDQSESISQHGNDYGSFDWDFSSAKGGDSVNPFEDSSSSSGTSSGGSTATSSCTPRSSSTSGSSSGGSSGSSATTTSGNSWWSNRPTARPSGWGGSNSKRASDDNSNYCDDGSSSSSSFGGGVQLGAGGPTGQQRDMLIAHGVLACLAFVIFFPFGAISIRLFSFPGLIWFHAAVQVLGYLLFIAAFGIGVYIAMQRDMINNYHPIIGIVLFILLFFQPIFGFLHHALFKKYGRRTLWSYCHLWVGRILITLGIINGGLGLLWANNATKSQYTAYGVVAGIIWLIYVLAAIYGEAKRARAPPAYSRSPPRKGSGGSGSSGSPMSERPEFYGRYNPKYSRRQNSER